MKVDLIKDTLKVYEDFKTHQKIVSSNIFWYVKVCIFLIKVYSVHSVHWNKTPILKNFRLEKNEGTKDSYFFSELQVITVFTFNLRFLYELK